MTRHDSQTRPPLKNNSMIDTLPVPEYLERGEAPIDIHYGNKYIVQDIEELREIGDEAMAAVREFQLAIRTMYVQEFRIFSRPRIRFTRETRAAVESTYEAEYRISVEIPEWLVGALPGDDGRVFTDEADYWEFVDEVLDWICPKNPDPSDRRYDLFSYVEDYVGDISIELRLGNTDAVRVLAFYCGVTKIQNWNDSHNSMVCVSLECAEDIYSIYRLWGLDVDFPEELIFTGSEPKPDRVILTPDEFFGLVKHECEEVCEVLPPV